MKKNKVLLQINSNANVGSVSRDAEGIGKAAIARGWDSYMAWGRKAAHSESTLIRIGNKLSSKFHGFYARMFDADGLGSEVATKNLIKRIEKIDPDLIILHNLHGYYLNYPVLFDYLNTSKKQVIWSLHDCWVFTGHCAHFITVGCNRWQTECNHCLLRSSYPQSWFLDKSHRNFKLKRDKFTSLNNMIVVGVSDWLKDLAAKSFLGKYPTLRIYNGINIETFKYRTEKKDLFPNIKILIGVSMKWSREKGLFDYIELAKILPNDYLILLVGNIMDKKVRNSLPSNILNIPRTADRIEMAQYYSRADVSLNLSYAETLGLTSIEAMSCGTPAVVYNATASPELITPETGIVVETCDIKAVVNAIIKLVKNGRNSYSEACRRRVVENFEEISNFGKYLDLYKE